MTDWIVNLGFNTGANSPDAELLWGVTTTQGGTGYLSNLRPNDTVQFAIYNVTAGVQAGSTQTTVSNFSVTSWFAQTGQVNTNPWGGSGTNPFSQNVIPTSWGSGSVPVFAGSSLPTVQVLSAGQSPIMATLNNQGQYAFTFNFIVTTTGGTQMPFSVDPVMIVTSGG